MAGGGTGGHIYPAIAIADTIKNYDKHAEILFIVTKNGMEKSLIEKAGYETYHIEMSGLQRRLSFRNIKTAFCFIKAPLDAKRLIASFSPDIAIGTGGYLCWPLLHSAARAGVPTLVHESNALPGKAVKMLEGEVDSVLLNFDSAKEHLKYPEKAIVCGNPVSFGDGFLSREEARKKLGISEKYVLLSFGGSLGARRINSAVLELMKNFSSSHPEVLHIHSAGSGRYDDFKREFDSLGLDKFKNIRAVPYIYDMPLWEAAADAMICRAGAMTISEAAQHGKACIFIPAPTVAENHQYYNSLRLSSKGAATLIEEKHLTEEALENEVKSLLFSPKGKELSNNIRAFASPDAKSKILDEVIRLVNRDVLKLLGNKEKK